MSLTLLLAYGSLLSPLVPLFLSWRRATKVKDVALLRGLLIVGLLFDTAGFAMALAKMSSNSVGNLFFLGQTLILIGIYANHIQFLHRYQLGIGLVTVFLFLGNYFFVQGYTVLNTYSITLSAFFFISIALLYFLGILRTLPEVFVHRMPMTWINIAVLVYFSGNLLVFLFNDNLIMTTTWVIHNMLNITKNLLFTVAIWHSQRKTKSYSS